MTFEGGLRVISEKNLAWKCQGKKYPALKKTVCDGLQRMEKKSYTGNTMGKRILHPEVWEKNRYPNQITHTPASSIVKFKWSTLNNMSKRFVF